MTISSTTAGAPPATEPRIGALLRLCAESVHTTLYERTAAAGYPELRPAHFRLLRFPGPDGVRPTELARRLDASKQAINPQLNDLERWGYLERRPDPGDQRGRLLHLTPRGHRLLTTIRSLHAEIERDLQERLGGESYAALVTALRELASDPPATGDSMVAQSPAGVTR